MLDARIFCIGLATSGFVIGYFTGVSSSPVTGAVVTSVFGGVVGLAGGFFSSRSAQTPAVSSPDTPKSTGRVVLRQWGLALIVFSLALLVGKVSGDFARIAWVRYSSQAPVIPWADSTPPEPPDSADKALRWLYFAHDASEQGLSPDQIKELYDPKQLPPDRSRWAGVPPLKP
jgi:hypothetical protein